MRKFKITQKQLGFYKLYKMFKEDPEKYLPTWDFGGEIYIPEIGRWELMTYKCPTRLTDLYKENPDLIKRRDVIGKSGAMYYEYRIAPDPTIGKIKDERLREFYLLIKRQPHLYHQKIKESFEKIT